MQKTRGKTAVYIISLTVIASCALRFFQLLKYTDKETGLIVGENNFSLIIYALIVVTVAVGAVYAYKRSSFNTLLDFEQGGRAEYISSAFLSTALFLDFIHQIYNCYSYLSSVSYVEYVYFIPLALSAFFAVISCFYFACFAQTAKGTNYDFRNFTALHFMPILWCFVKLIIIMLKIIDVRLGIETVIEFMLIVSLIMFLFCYVSMVDNDGEVSKLFVFFALTTFVLSIILVAPRLAVILIGKYKLLSRIDYSMLSYMASGFFAVTLLRKSNKKD